MAAKAKLAAEHNRIAGELVVALKNYSRESRLRRAAWLAFDALEAEWRSQDAVRHRVIEDLKADSLSLVANSSRATDEGYRRVFWEILPAGEGSFAALWADYRSYLRLHPGAKLEPERLKYLDSLGPSVRYRGLNEWRDYRVFGFPELQRAAFECPVSGNALFVVDFGQWARLSRLTKEELRRLPECEARIIHRDTWKETLRANLGLKPEWVETLENNFLCR